MGNSFKFDDQMSVQDKLDKYEGRLRQATNKLRKWIILKN